MIGKIRQLPDRNFLFDVLKIAVSSAVLGVVLYVLNLNLFAAMAVSVVVYFAVFVLIRGIDQDDKLIIKQIIGR